MQCKVKLLRTRGARKHEREILSEDPVTGDMTLAMVAGVYELNLSASDDSQMKPLIPVLYDARLVTMHGNKMLFRGLERAGDEPAAQYLQEWSVMVLPA
jgi:hypothetical protein